MKLIPTKIDHFDLLELRPEESNLTQNYFGVEKAKALVDLSMANTLMDDGRIIAIVGFYELWQGVYELWAVPSVHIEKHPVAYVRQVKRYVKQIYENFGAHRLQTTSIANHKHDKWMEALGFSYEGTLAKFGPDMLNYRMWAITK